MLTLKPKTKIVATILAKNEEDILGPMIQHTINQGVSQIIFTDNASRDRTRGIAASYPEVVEIIDEPGDDHNQTKWVTRMARLACKLKPDWIIHLDADEFWCGIQNLRKFDTAIVGCERMYLHPPVGHFTLGGQRHYLDFDHIPIPQECKVAHRPMEDIVITHGNHGVAEPTASYTSTTDVYRHHYPIRSCKQWEQKASGHLALERRGSYCKRWSKWYDLFCEPAGWPHPPAWDWWDGMTKLWSRMINDGVSHDDFIALASVWAEDDMIEFFKNRTDMLPRIGEWPKDEK
jgi:glycosyltransferase involved in cell wall biosynthesis